MDLLRSVRIKVLLFTVICIPLPAAAEIIQVPVDYPTIQSGIDNASHGDTILVQEGIYYELIDFQGISVLLTSTYLIDGDTSSILQTVIDGDSSLTGGGSVVSFVNGEDSTSALNGFTIRNGIGTYREVGSYRGYIGGGIYSITSSPRICNNIIINNTADALPIDGQIGKGGGIYLYEGTPKIIRNYIMNNVAYRYGFSLIEGEGGGIYLDHCDNAIISKNIITQNEAGIVGAGIFANHSPATIEDNVISYNKVSGGISCDSYYLIGTPIIIRDNEIIGNELSGIIVSEGYYSEISHNIVAFNTLIYGISCSGIYSYHRVINNTVIANGLNSSPNHNAGISVLSDTRADVVNNIIALNNGYGIHTNSENNDIECNYNNIWANVMGEYDEIEPGDGDISCNPLLINPLDKEFGISVSSPCIDAGDPNAIIPEYGGDRIDIGAYEYIQLVDDYDLFNFGPNLDLVRKGTMRSWNYSVFNPLPFPVTIDIWFEYSGSECGIAETILDKTIAANSGYQGSVEIEVPDSLGSYTMKGRIGDYQESIWDSDVFDLVVYDITLDPNVGTNAKPVQSKW